MNNDVLMALIVAVVTVAAVVTFITGLIGVHGSLANAKVGEVYNFEYEQPYHGERKRILAKVIEPVLTLDEQSIRRLNARSRYRSNDPVFKRSHHLVTCEMPTGEVRNFYAERASKVRRSVFGTKFLRNAVASVL
jgi:hypothetical protein